MLAYDVCNFLEDTTTTCAQRSARHLQYWSFPCHLASQIAVLQFKLYTSYACRYFICDWAPHLARCLVVVWTLGRLVDKNLDYSVWKWPCIQNNLVQSEYLILRAKTPLRLWKCFAVVGQLRLFSEVHGNYHSASLIILVSTLGRRLNTTQRGANLLHVHSKFMKHGADTFCSAAAIFFSLASYEPSWRKCSNMVVRNLCAVCLYMWLHI